MKSRYLFPLLYIVADAIAILFIDVPAIPLTISLFSLPSSFVMRMVSRAIGVPTDPAYAAYFVVLGTILQMFLLGLALELLASTIQRLFDRKRIAV